ncbi:MAG: TldD/PmbA family protein [Lachnospiraceae bacterium]|nr:TldD/PmbA family protein [Lachnospiraceae bacterium]
MYSEYLKSRHDLCKELVNRLSPDYGFVSVLGKQISGISVRVTTTTTSVTDSIEQECGFVVKLFNGRTYSEYSFTDITAENIDELEKKIRTEIKISDKLLDNHVDIKLMQDEPLVKDYVRPEEGKRFTVPEVVEKLTAYKNAIHAASEKVVQAMSMFSFYEVSAMFVSPKRDLTQNYSWSTVASVAVAREGANVRDGRVLSAFNSQEQCFEDMDKKVTKCADLAVELLSAENIEPGVYDIITAPSITGLIAHEAFGHGVEMDMFVKHRAMARKYVGKEVASELVDMHDGAAATKSCVGYFFDDDGIPAHDTLIIKKGILQTGISDAISAMQLGTEPTGNGRRESTKRKAYTRMTNTFFSAGTDKVEDMIKSVEHGYMLFETDNGMEDPKNWNIQCVASYGREIKDGKFTGKIVAPVVMSGYVPDLLKSISMVSDEWEVTGSGHCGKGYKEWVPVSDGGPYLKARCKLG